MSVSSTTLAVFDSLPLAVQLAVAAQLVVCGVFTLAGAIGLQRFGDVYMRLHAPTKASTLGVGGALLASLLLSWAGGQAAWQLMLVALFVFVTAPVSANLLAMSALHLRLPSSAPLPPDQPQD